MPVIEDIASDLVPEAASASPGPPATARPQLGHAAKIGNDFQRKHPQLAKDEVLADAGMTVVRREIEKDLKAMGIPDDRIAP